MLTHFTVTPAILLALEALRVRCKSGPHGIHQTAQGPVGVRWMTGDRVEVDTEAVVEPYVSYFKGQAITPMGAFSYSHSPMGLTQPVGRYCSIASGVKNFSVKHPLEFVSTNPFNTMTSGVYQLAWNDHPGHHGEVFNALQYNVGQYDHAVIGHDVWIGEGAILGRNITIGTGAVIGAGAVVTKDVPPYSIVAGVPAKVIRYRFPDAVVEALLASRWWEYHFADFNGLAYNDPVRFVGELQDAVAAGRIAPYVPPQIPFVDRLEEALAELGEALPSNMVKDRALSRERAALATDFPVPAGCSTWFPPERDRRDGGPMRFFGTEAWLDIDVPSDATKVRVLIHHQVTDSARDGLTVRLADTPLERLGSRQDQHGRTELELAVPPGLQGQTGIRFHLHSPMTARPNLVHPGSSDIRNLSVAVSRPQFA